MPKVAVRIPQIGEGLQEARLVATLKNPGDRVKRDEPIYQMETDKAVMDVESPYEGVLSAWLADVDTVLAIGAEVATMEVEGEVAEMQVHGAPASASATAEASTSTAPAASNRLTGVPPRTRAYAKEKGLSDSDLAQLATTKDKLMPSDIDDFLAGGGASNQVVSADYAEVAMSQKQRLLSSRLARGAQLVVPGTISVQCSWEGIDNLRTRVKSSGSDFQPSAFTMFAYCVALALRDFPAFRTILRGDDTLRTYQKASLGIAVALPGDELVVAVVEGADHMTWREFADASRRQIEEARTGKDQATEATTISLTNMQSFGLRDAVPVVVSPAVATLFLGEVYNGLDDHPTEIRMKRCVNLALTFDHRLINGVGAAEFLNKVKTNVETVSSLITV